MALINCPECSKQISDKSKNCIHCGFPINESEPDPEAKTSYEYHEKSENIEPDYQEEEVEDEDEPFLDFVDSEPHQERKRHWKLEKVLRVLKYLNFFGILFFLIKIEGAAVSNIFLKLTVFLWFVSLPVTHLWDEGRYTHIFTMLYHIVLAFLVVFFYGSIF